MGVRLSQKRRHTQELLWNRKQMLCKKRHTQNVLWTRKHTLSTRGGILRIYIFWIDY